jgi:hypothetical protein
VHGPDAATASTISCRIGETIARSWRSRRIWYGRCLDRWVDIFSLLLNYEYNLSRRPYMLRGFERYAFPGLLLLLSTAAFVRSGSPTRFDEIDVERINVVERDGKVRLVISNRARSPAPLERGKPFGYPGGNRPGLIFYNDEQTEDGGLVFSGARDSTGHYEASGTFTFDHYEQDQTIALQYVDGNGRRRAGLSIIDRPTGATGAQFDARMKSAQKIPDSAARADSIRRIASEWGRGRLYAGRTVDGASQVILFDGTGRPRLRLRVDSAGAPRIEFLNDSGRVVRAIRDTT